MINGDRILVLNYDSQTYAFLIGEVRNLYIGAKQKIATTALDLFDGSKLQLSSLESVRAFRVSWRHTGQLWTHTVGVTDSAITEFGIKRQKGKPGISYNAFSANPESPITETDIRNLP
jgi:hypothetical protein